MTPRSALARRLEDHREALSACRRCDPTAEVQPIVSIARRPRAMLVGQAPGQVERTGGRPFSGRAGRTLFDWLASVGVAEDAFRDQVYIAAITRCYPGPSPSGRGDRVPSRREREECGRWLDAELALMRPKLIIPVGRLAIDRFLGPLPLEEVVGQTHRVKHIGGESDCIPLPHPSGASAWVHEAGHRALLRKALRRLGAALRMVGVAAALLLAITRPAAAQTPDRFFGPDKIQHFFLSAFIQSFTYSALRATNADRQSSLIGASAATASLGIWKELRDRRIRRQFSVRDLMWDAAGAGVATVFLNHSRH